MRTAKTLIRLGECPWLWCPWWSKYWLGASGILFVSPCSSSINIIWYNCKQKMYFLRSLRSSGEKLADGAKYDEVASASCRILATTTIFITRWTLKKSNFNSYINTLFLHHFCVLIVKARCKMCKIRGEENLLTNLFGHNVKQPSSWHDVNRTLRWPIKTFVYPWLRLTTTSLDQWCPSVYEASWSIKVHLREVSCRCKYSLFWLNLNSLWALIKKYGITENTDMPLYYCHKIT